jgi:hypothetical protein
VVQSSARAFGRAAEAGFPEDRRNSGRIDCGTSRTQIVEERRCFGLADRSLAQHPHDEDSRPVAQLDLDSVSDSQSSVCLYDPTVHSYPAEVAGTGGLRAGLEDPRYLKPFVETNGHVSRV